MASRTLGLPGGGGLAGRFFFFFFFGGGGGEGRGMVGMVDTDFWFLGFESGTEQFLVSIVGRGWWGSLWFWHFSFGLGKDARNWKGPPTVGLGKLLSKAGIQR